jgi:ATP-binding cassette subfamily C protein LapB
MKSESASPKAPSAPPGDALLECLVFLTAHHGRAKSAEAIRAGLAYDEKGMGPNLFCEAAERMGLKAKIMRRAAIGDIPDAVLPVVLMLKDNRAGVLVARAGSKIKIHVPGAGMKEMDEAALEKSYAGYAIFVHPRAEFTDPQAPKDEDLARHWFWGVVLENRGLYGRVAIAAALVNLFGLTSSVYIMNVYNRVIPNNAMETGWVLAIGAMTVLVFDFIIRTLRGYFIDLAGRRIDVVVTRRIYDQLLNIKLAKRPASSGAFANMLREFESVRDFMTSATMTALVDLPFTLFFLFVIYLFGGAVAFILASLIIVTIGAGMLLQWPLKAMVGKSMQSAETKHGLLVETINGLETIKAIGADGRMRARYGVHVGDSAAHGQQSRFISGLGVNIATFLQQAASIIVVLLGMYLVRDGSMTMGALIACVLLGGRAIAPIGQIANLLARYHQTRKALDTLNGIMAAPVERPAGKQFLHRPHLTGKIALDKVSFAYPGTDRKVLDKISFTIQPGERVGLVGRIGSGKSTIARLVMGLYDPSEGTIFADDTDYRQIDPADMRMNIAYIAQDVVLFRGSVRENIAVSRPHATEEEILVASKASGAHDFISRHPMGYDAPVGERGEGLSGGQRQAIALARAMLLKPHVMVCDEPTNAMDMEAEAAFVRHIGGQIKDKTFLLITHRQHLLKLVDRLILIDQGVVVMDGPRDKVLEALAGGKVSVPT